MFRVILENKFRENPINLSRAVKLLYNQDFTGSIRLENILWWKKYFLKVIHLRVLYPKTGYIQIVKIYRDYWSDINLSIDYWNAFEALFTTPCRKAK